MKTIIRNANVVNEGKITVTDILIHGERIEKIAASIQLNDKEKHIEIDAEGLYLLPGMIDDQVHFRDPGLTHKATIASESRAAVAGGITSFMDMPNTIPNVLTHELLEKKYHKAIDIGAGEGFVAKHLPADMISGIELSETAKLRFPANVIPVKEPIGKYDLVVSTGTLYQQYDH